MYPQLVKIYGFYRQLLSYLHHPAKSRHWWRVMGCKQPMQPLGAMLIKEGPDKAPLI